MGSMLSQVVTVGERGSSDGHPFALRSYFDVQG